MRLEKLKGSKGAAGPAPRSPSEDEMMTGYVTASEMVQADVISGHSDEVLEAPGSVVRVGGSWGLTHAEWQDGVLILPSSRTNSRYQSTVAAPLALRFAAFASGLSGWG
eukprot:2868650-Rhodomonas_salina.1